MPIPLSCACGRALRARDELAGRKVNCPDCGAVLIVPIPEPGPDAEEIRPPPLNDPWAEPPPRGEKSQPDAAADEVIGEVLPVDPDEDEEDDDGEVSQRERVRRREALEADREAERDRKGRQKRRARSTTANWPRSAGHGFTAGAARSCSVRRDRTEPFTLALGAGRSSSSWASCARAL